MNKLKTLLIIALMGLSSISTSAQKGNNATDNTVVFYMVRHGKTILNTVDRVQGWSDSPLTPAGIEVAEYLGLGLKDVNFKSAYCSDLGRARQTVRIVLDKKGQQNLKATEVPEIRETNFGSYEGDLNSRMWSDAAFYLQFRSKKELFEALGKNPDLMKNCLASFKALETLGIGEDYNEVKTRGQKAIKEIAEIEAKKGGGNVILVGHGMSLSIFLSDIDSTGKKSPGGHMGNAAVCKVIYKNGKFTLESYGDMSYVEKGKKMK